jgi:SSS family solute:Na+ symporter
MTKAAAIASMFTGFMLSAFWVLFIKASEAGAIGLVEKVAAGKSSLLADRPNWPVVEPIVIALPISILVAIIVSLATKRPTDEHLAKCFDR